MMISTMSTRDQLLTKVGFNRVNCSRPEDVLRCRQGVKTPLNQSINQSKRSPRPGNKMITWKSDMMNTTAPIFQPFGKTLGPVAPDIRSHEIMRKKN